MTDSSPQEQQPNQSDQQTSDIAGLLADLTTEIERLQQWQPQSPTLRRRLRDGFLVGIASGLGRAVGATVILGLLVWLVGRLQVVPVLGRWIAGLIEVIEMAPP